MYHSTSDLKAEDLGFWEMEEGPIGYNLGSPNGEVSEHFFPLHYSCKNIAKEVFHFAKQQAKGTEGAIPCSWADLYLALESQYELDLGKGSDMMSLKWSHWYHGASAFHEIGRTSHDHPKSDWIRAPESQVLLLMPTQ